MSAEDKAEELINGISTALDLQAQRRVNCEIKGFVIRDGIRDIMLSTLDDAWKNFQENSLENKSLILVAGDSFQGLEYTHYLELAIYKAGKYSCSKEIEKEKGWSQNEKIQQVYDEVTAKVKGIQQFIKDFYVIEDLQASKYKMHEFDSLDEAIECYEYLPRSDMKALGINNTKGGALDFLHCVDETNKILDDFKKVESWSNEKCISEAVKAIKIKFLGDQAMSIIADMDEQQLLYGEEMEY